MTSSTLYPAFSVTLTARTRPAINRVPPCMTPARQVHHHLLPGGTCKRHAVSHALADRPRRVLCRTAGFGAGNKDSFLPIHIIGRQLHGNDIPRIFDAADQDIQPFPPYHRRTRYQAVGRNGDVSGLQGLEQPESYPASLFDSLVFRDAAAMVFVPIR